MWQKNEAGRVWEWQKLGVVNCKKCAILWQRYKRRCGQAGAQTVTVRGCDALTAEMTMQAQQMNCH
jgi:hypothetical protein